MTEENRLLDRNTGQAQGDDSCMLFQRDCLPEPEDYETSAYMYAKTIECPIPRTVGVSEVVIDWEWLSGSFKVTLDNRQLPEPLLFGINRFGMAFSTIPRLQYQGGRATSFRIYRMSHLLRKAVDRALQMVIPSIPGVPREPIDGDNPRRLAWDEGSFDPQELARAKAMIAEGGILATVVITDEERRMEEEESLL